MLTTALPQPVGARNAAVFHPPQGLARLASFVAALLLLMQWSAHGAASRWEGALDQPAPASGNHRVAAIIERVRAEHGMPALATAIVSSRGLAAQAAAGWRKAGESAAVTTNDLWHLGSETKAMTATLAARLVERGKLRWTTRLADTFPELAEQMDPAFHDVTLEQLLSHRAGLPSNLIWSTFNLFDSSRAAREAVVKAGLGSPPKFPPGRETHYSNLGYVVAGAMIERVLNEPWEEAIRREVFEPLGMKRVGFGGVGTPGRLDQPWGHDRNGKPVPHNGPDMDNPPVIGPAGRVHATLADWARFVADQLRGARGEPALLRPNSYRRLHTPPSGAEMALGWAVTQRDWAGGRALHHTGSNTMNYANVWLAPAKGFAVLVCCNRGGDDAFKATDAAVAALIPLARQLTNAKP